MKENEWIKLGNEMPKLGMPVEVIFGGDTRYCSTEIAIARLLRCDNWDFNFVDDLGDKILYVRGWRRIKEKRPDFSKLNRGDLIYIHTDSPAYCQIGFYCSHDNIEMKLSEFKDLDSYEYGASDMEKIKKITRINLEEQKFEEI